MKKKMVEIIKKAFAAAIKKKGKSLTEPEKEVIKKKIVGLSKSGKVAAAGAGVALMGVGAHTIPEKRRKEEEIRDKKRKKDKK